MKGQNTRTNSQKTNGHRRSNSQFSNQGSTPSPTRGTFGGTNNSKNSSSVISNERILGTIGRAVGKKCTVSLVSGVRYQGTLASADTSPPKSIVLSNVKILGKVAEKTHQEKEPANKLTIQLKNVYDFEVDGTDSKQGKKQVDRADIENTANKGARQDDSKFKTDSDISGKGKFEERELKRWTPDVDDKFQMTLEDSAHDGGSHWDQFEVNEKKFGVESTYDEHHYTTRINTQAPDYEERLRKADEIAKDIESQGSTNLHVLEERGVQLDDSGLDEEDKYSGVDRRGDELLAALKGTSISSNVPPTVIPNRGSGSYVPPRQRAAHYHNDPAIVSSSVTSRKKHTDDSETNQQNTNAVNSASKPFKPDSIPPKPPVNNLNESFRLNARSEINSLREFSANFKIPHKIPTDLLPILSKDKIKQDEILKKQHQKQKRDQEGKNLPPKTQNTSHDTSSVKKKLDPTKPAFKPNPKAAAFTPSSKTIQSPSIAPRTTFYRSPNNPSPRLNHSRPYSSGASSGNSSGGGSSKRHQISPADFFGGPDKVPTKDDQDKKIQLFRFAFNLFVTTKKRHEEKKTPVIFDKTFQTPPTWDYTVDESHDKLFASITRTPSFGMGGNVPFLSSPLVGAPVVAGGYPTPNGAKFPLSPQQHTAAMAAQFQQQQIHAAMMYQQQFPNASPSQPMNMYGGDPAFLPPAGFMPPPVGFVAGGSPVNNNLVLNSPNYNGGNHNSHYNHHGNNRRYNNQSQAASPNKHSNSNQKS